MSVQKKVRVQFQAEAAVKSPSHIPHRYRLGRDDEAEELVRLNSPPASCFPAPTSISGSMREPG